MIGAYFPTDGAWSSTKAYIAGQLVTYAGVTYGSLASNTNREPDINPSYWTRAYWSVVESFAQLNHFTGINGNRSIQPAIYAAGGVLVTPRPNASVGLTNPDEGKCGYFAPYSAEADTMPSFEWRVAGSCTNPAYLPHLMARFSLSAGCPNGPPNGYRVCLDPLGTEGSGAGGNFIVNGNLLARGAVTLATLPTGVLSSTGGVISSGLINLGLGVTGTLPNSNLFGNGLVNVAAGSGIAISGSPVAPGGTVTITNTAPGGTVTGGTFSCAAGQHIASITISSTGVLSGTCD